MRDIWITGVGHTVFARHPERSLADLAMEAAVEAAEDAGVGLDEIDAVFFSNSTWGYFDNQHCIRAQVAFQGTPLAGKPMVNVENACAGASTALHLARTSVAAGQYGVVLAVGAEKIFNADTGKMFGAFLTALDVARAEEHLGRLMGLRGKAVTELNARRPELAARMPRDEGGQRTVFMDVYAAFALWHMARFGSTPEQLAAIAAKNHNHAVANPKAQIRIPMTPEEVLADRLVSWPLTRSMCSPIGDGAAAAIVVSDEIKKRRDGSRAVRIRASALRTGTARDVDDVESDIAVRTVRAAYNEAGVTPEEIDVAEIHDATAFGELHQSEALGFCPMGEGGVFALEGHSTIGGRLPINTSGGLECRGHPIGASGLAQIHELVLQLRGEAGERQVEGVRLALAENGGGNIGYEEATLVIHILEGP
ncbi:MAG TPA: thiolase family protein [Acidobacteria bacterium]|nr:thiolase family protein [Acidobacteriota bacterium]